MARRRNRASHRPAADSASNGTLRDIAAELGDALPAEMFGEDSEPEATEPSEEVETPQTSRRGRRRRSKSPAEEPAGEAQTAPAEPDAEEEGPGEESDDQPEEVVTLTTLSDFAEAAGVEVDELLNLQHTVKASGEGRNVSLRDLVNGFQFDADYTKKSQAVAELRKQVEADNEARQQTFAAMHQAIADQYRENERRLVERFNSPDLARLETEDPVAWMTQRQRLQEEYQAELYRRQQAAQQFQQQQAYLMQQQLQQEAQVLKELRPEWTDADNEAVRGVWKDLGFSQREINASNHSARLLAALRELAEYRAAERSGKAKSHAAKRIAASAKAKAIPPVQKPGGGARVAGQIAVAAKQRQLRDLKNKLRKSGKVGDAAALLAQRFSRS